MVDKSSRAGNNRCAHQVCVVGLDLFRQLIAKFQCLKAGVRERERERERERARERECVCL